MEKKIREKYDKTTVDAGRYIHTPYWGILLRTAGLSKFCVRKPYLYVGCNALEAAKSHSKQREQPQLDLQTICLDINITTPSQYMERLVGILRE
jgi:hypothetical protein